jgi:hypothetical protein
MIIDCVYNNRVLSLVDLLKYVSQFFFLITLVSQIHLPRQSLYAGSDHSAKYRVEELICLNS